MRAVEDGNIEAIELFIQQNADVNHICVCRVTPLLLAVQNNDIDTVNILIKYGADPNFVPKHRAGKTILMESAIKDNKQIMEALLNANARINDVTKYTGNNSLILAAAQGAIECLKILTSKRLKYRSPKQQR